MKTGLCIALYEEAENLINLLGSASSVERHYDGSTFYDYGDTVLAISGVGTIASAMATVLLISVYKCDRILNFGCSGCTGNIHNVGDIVTVEKVYKNDVDLTLLGYEINQMSNTEKYLYLETDPNYPKITCCSGDKYITRGSNIPPDTATDMEAFSVAYVCSKYNIPCKSYKIISDTCDKNYDAEEYMKNSKGVSNILCEHIFRTIKKA